jgi:salicylate hydroxylase
MPSEVLPETLVVGGGIGGLCAALCLARRGGDVTVLERSKSFAEVGAGIQLAPNAIRILRELGVLEQIEPVAVLPRRLVLADAVGGGELTSLDLTDFPDRYGAPYLVLHRNDLLIALLEGCAANGVRLLTDAGVVELTQTATGVAVICEDGREFTGDVAIGADGLHSRIRKFFVEDEPINSGFVAYRGAVPMEQVARHADLRDVVAWIGPGLHLVQYPLRSGQMYNQVAVFRSEAYLRGEADYGNPDELWAAFAGCCEHVRESLPTLKIDNRWPMLDRLPMPDWARGRVALLGDAAHPMLQYLAQGACQALEDAAALAAALAAAAAAGRPVSAGLASYAALRAPRAMRVQQSARTWGEIWHVDGVAKLIRDELLRTRDVADHRHVTWLYGDTVAGDPVAEPDVGRTTTGPEAVPSGETVRTGSAGPAGPIGPRS